MPTATPLAILTATTFGFGLMALLTLAFGMVERSVERVHLRSAIHGLTFGAGAVLAMLEPVRLADGVIFDARAIVVGLAAGFGGWPAALVAATIAGGTRLHLGGLGAPAGTAGIAIAALMGLLWSLRCRPEGRADVACLAWLGGAVALNTASVVLLPPALIWPVLTTAVPYLAAASLVGAVIMGTLLDRERQNLRAELSWQRSATTDPLTGLPNRRAFDQALNEASSSSGPDRSCAVLLVDADHFKRVNDRHGHAVGDAALRFLADLLRRALPEGARACRIGGEEFAVVLPGSMDREAHDIAEAIRRSVQATPFVHDGTTVPLSVSVGVAMRQGREEIDAGVLLRAADVALYAAKAGGRNRVVVNTELRRSGGRSTAVLMSQEGEDEPQTA